MRRLAGKAVRAAQHAAIGDEAAAHTVGEHHREQVAASMLRHEVPFAVRGGVGVVLGHDRAAEMLPPGCDHVHIAPTEQRCGQNNAVARHEARNRDPKAGRGPERVPDGVHAVPRRGGRGWPPAGLTLSAALFSPVRPGSRRRHQTICGPRRGRPAAREPGARLRRARRSWRARRRSRLAAHAPDNLASLTGLFDRPAPSVTAVLLQAISADAPGVYPSRSCERSEYRPWCSAPSTISSIPWRTAETPGLR